MKKILFTILLLAAAINAYAYDFSAVCSTGQTLYYNITSDSTVEITYPGDYGDLRVVQGYSSQIHTDPYNSYFSHWINNYNGGYLCYQLQQEYERPSGFLRIPDTVVYNDQVYKVSAIKYRAFYNCTGIDSLYIGCNIDTIRKSAFMGCSGINYLYFNAKKCNYGYKMLSNYTTNINCTGCEYNIGLSTVIIGDGVKEIPDDAFTKCYSLSNLYISNSVTSIGNNAFSNDSSLTTIIIPSSVQFIGANAFEHCTGITAVSFAAANCRTTNSNTGFFRNCPNLSTINIGNNVKRIPHRAFSNCNNLVNVFIGDSVRTIEDSAFYQCSSISTVELPYFIDSIGAGAFAGCSNISFIHIPWSVADIGNNAFQQVGSICYNGSAMGIPWGANSAVTCPDTVGLIFLDSTRTVVTGYVGTNPTVTIPETVTVINQQAFKNCGHLCSVFIPNTVQSIGAEAFYGCERLKSIAFPNSLISIGNNAFYGCDSISSITIPASVVNIGEYAFAGCSRVNSIIVNSGNTHYDSRENCNAIIETSTNKLLQGCNSTVMPSTVSRIGGWAFWGCDGLASVNIPEGVDTIHNGTFMGCSSLEEITIPNSVSVIGPSAFSGCTNMRRLSIGSSVNSIGLNAFDGCDSIEELYYNTPYISNIKNHLPNQIQQILRRLVIGDEVQIIPHGAFSDFTALNFLYVGNSIDTIAHYAFSGCVQIDSIYIGWNVKKIEKYAFVNVRHINHLFFNAENVSPTSVVENFYPSSNDSTYILTNYYENLSSYGPPYYASCLYTLFRKGCSINEVIVGNNVRNLPSGSFIQNSIGKVYLGENIEQINPYCFQDCSIDTLHYNIKNLTSTLRDGNDVHQFTFGGTVVSRRSPFIGSTVDYLVLGDSVRTIPSGAFRSYNMQKLFLPDGITHIGYRAFSGCNNIDSIYFGTNIQIIEGLAFWGCNQVSNIYYNCIRNNSGLFNEVFDTNTNKMVNITLGDSVKKIPDYCFRGRNAITNLNLNVDTICTGAFSNCDNLLTATVNASQIGENAFANCDRLVSVTLGDSAETLGSGAFNGCFRLQNIHLGGVTSIGDSAFQGCVRMERPELPDGLTYIGARAFSGCSLLNGKLTFPTTITNIGDYAYSGTGTITGIDMLGATPPTIYAHTFASVSNSTPVSVPCGAVMNYYTTNFWENFSTIQEAPPYKLTVQSNNETMGSAAISQQPTCSNHSAIIQATAETGFHFIQWSDGNGTNPRTVNMTQDSSFTAIFVPNNIQVNVVPNDPLRGTTTGSGTYGWNAPVTMTATAYDGYHFLKWNDGNTQNPRYMAAVRDTTFTAIFVSNVSTITVMNANPEWGNVSGSGVYYYMNLVSLTATPVYGYHFSRWNDGNTQNPRTITVIQDSSFTAYFAVNTYSIVGTSNSTAMGSVTGGGTYTYLHEMSLTATPAFGYHFVQWNDQNTDNPRTITVTRDSAFTAQFAANSYVITAEPNDPTMGSAYGSGTYNFNTTATLTAVAEYGYHFTQWSDGVTDNPRSVTVQNSTTYTAQFEINSYILTVQSSNPAIGTTSGGGSYNYLTPVNISANPNAGYHFTQWSDGNTDNPRLVTVTQNATYTAQFAINSYAVGVVSGNTSMGSVSGSGTYNHNTTATLTATAFYGYHFVQWQDGNTENPRSVVVTDSAQYTAQFDYNSYLVTANSSNVTLGSATGGGSYNYLSQVALTAVAVPHYHFTMWNDSIEDNPRTIIVTRDTMFTAHFAIDRHTIGVNSADATMGSASGSDTVNYNTAVWITATANYGYHFTHWQDGNSSNPRRVVVSQDTVFSASFAPNQYSVTTSVNNTTMGSVTAGGTYTYLTPLTLTATANYGYHFTGWSDGVTENPRSFTLTQDTSFTAVFAVNQYYVTLVSNDSTLGTVQGGGEYNYLSQVTITATAAPHSHFVQWSDGNTTNPRLVTLTRDTTFTALFEQDQQFLITVNANDTTMGSVGGSGTYFIGETVSITATANEHYYFSQWSDGVTSNPRVVTVIGDASYTAVFEPVMYTLTVEANDYSMGQVTGGGSYAYGTVVTIEARAFDDYRFVRWSDGDTAAVRTVTVMEDLRLEATFERKHPDGIDDVDGMSYKVYVQNGHIVVEGLENHREARVTVFDVAGRRRSLTETFPTGVYMVKIGGWAKKVVVM